MIDLQLAVTVGVVVLSFAGAVKMALHAAEEIALMDIAWEIAQQIPDRPSVGQYISVLHPRFGVPTEITMPCARASVLAFQVLYPRSSGCGTTLIVALAIAGLAYSSFSWHFALILPLAMVPLSWPIRAILPSQRKVMLNAVEMSLAKRLKHFERNGDAMRAEACEFLARWVKMLPEKPELRV